MKLKHVLDISSVHHQRVYSLYTQQWYMSYRSVDSFQAGPGLSSILVLLKSCLQTCMTYTIAECTVNKLSDDGQRKCPKHVEFRPYKTTNVMHLILFIRQILLSSTCFEYQILILRRTQLYMSSIWYRHSL